MKHIAMPKSNGRAQYRAMTDSIYEQMEVKPLSRSLILQLLDLQFYNMAIILSSMIPTTMHSIKVPNILRLIIISFKILCFQNIL